MVTWRNAHSPVSGKRQHTPGPHPKMCGTHGGSIRKQESEEMWIHIRRRSGGVWVASSTAHRNDAHGRELSCTSTASFARRDATVGAARVVGK